MTERFLSPVIKYTTSTLKTLPGALLYFYETGTSTPKTTWTDPERATASAHPVVALSDGTFPPIFINGVYRVELKNAAGVTQPGWPVDDVGAPAAGFPFQSWSSTYSYSEDDLVTYNGEFYQSLDDDNVGNTPSTATAFWQKKVFLDAPTAESYLNGNADGTYTWRTIEQTKSDLSLYYDNVDDLALAGLPVDLTVFTRGADAIGDGGHAQFLVTDVEPDIVDGYSGVLLANSIWAAMQPVNAAVNVMQFGVTAGLISPALNRAIAYLNSIGGGTVVIPAGSYTLNNESGSPASWDNRYAVYLNVDNINIRGAGVGATILALNDAQDCHVFKVGTRTGGTLTVDNCSISCLTIDGNRDNQEVPDDTDYHNGGIDVASGCTGIALEKMHIHHTMYYGIGMQRDEFYNCTVRDILIEDTGGDGIDWKDDSQTSSGNICENVTTKRHGLLVGLSTDQAGVDLRSGVAAKNLNCSEYGAGTGLIGIRTQQGTDAVGSPSAIPTQSTTIDGFYCKADTATGTSGLRSIIPYGKYSNGEASGNEFGIDLSYQDAALENITSLGNTHNYNHRVSSAVNPANHVMTNCVSRSGSASGVTIRAGASNISYVNATNRGSLVGWTIEATATDCSILGGNSSNTTNLSDSGTNTTIIGVAGLRTKTKTASTGIAIDSTGTKSFTIAHGMSFTPSINDVELTLQRDTNVGDWTYGFFWVTGVDATNITGQLRVTAASATGGATVKAVATISAKNS